MALRKREDEVFPNASGIDIGASSHWVAVPRHLGEAAGDEPVREVGAMTEDLNAMARWLVKLGVDTVAVESTGVYWIPVFEVLEQHGLKVWHHQGAHGQLARCTPVRAEAGAGDVRRHRPASGRVRWPTGTVA